MHRNTTTHRLIDHKALQLSETPRVKCCALRPSSPNPRANVCQIFDGNRSLRVFGLRNNPFGETVVDVFGKAAFLTGKNTKAAAAPQRAKSLQLISEPPMPIANILDCLAGVDFPITISCDAIHAQVNPKHAFHVDWFGCLNLGGGEQVPLTTHERQISFAASECKQLSLAFAAHERDFLSPLERPDRDSGVLMGVRQNALIIGNRAVGLKRALSLSIQLIGIRDLGDTAHRQLRRQRKRFSRGLIGQPVDGELAKRLALPRHLADVVAGGIRRLKRAPERISLFGRGQQFQLDRQSHNMIVPQSERPCECARKRLKARRSSRP